jgi:type IV secretory pathway protease TraF
MAQRRAQDPAGRAMPWWNGCKQLGADELLLLSADSPRAFDGRYFGVSRSSQLVGKARLIHPSMR